MAQFKDFYPDWMFKSADKALLKVTKKLAEKIRAERIRPNGDG